MEELRESNTTENNPVCKYNYSLIKSVSHIQLQTSITAKRAPPKPRTCEARPSSPAAGWRTRPWAAPPGPDRTAPVPRRTTCDWARPDPPPRPPGKSAPPPPASSTADGPGGGQRGWGGAETRGKDLTESLMRSRFKVREESMTAKEGNNTMEVNDQIIERYRKKGQRKG